MGRVVMEAGLDERSVGAVLRLVGCEPAGSILMALGQRPLRTKQLTEQIPDFSARSVYRCLGKLGDHGLVERNAGRILLTDPGGRNLFRLLRAITTTSAAAFSDDGGNDLSWASICLLGELWESGLVSELSHGSSTLVDLLDAAGGLTYHQVRRRTSLFMDQGLVEVDPDRNGSGRHYQLTDRSRRLMVVIASLGRWRHRHFLADGTPGLELEEMGTVLRATLPLVALPEHSGMSIDVAVTGPEDRYGHRETVSVRGVRGEDGSLRVSQAAEGDADGSAAATLNTWFAALLDGNRGRIRVRGDLALVDGCLTQLHGALWKKS